MGGKRGKAKRNGWYRAKRNGWYRVRKIGRVRVRTGTLQGLATQPKTVG